MAESTFPRLSEAADFLPMLRGELVQAARTHLYPLGVRVEFRPIVEDGLFGFELDTDASAATYVVIGQTTHGQPVVRLSRYRGDADDPTCYARWGSVVSDANSSQKGRP